MNDPTFGSGVLGGGDSEEPEELEEVEARGLSTDRSHSLMVLSDEPDASSLRCGMTTRDLRKSACASVVLITSLV